MTFDLCSTGSIAPEGVNSHPLGPSTASRSQYCHPNAGTGIPGYDGKHQYYAGQFPSRWGETDPDGGLQDIQHDLPVSLSPLPFFGETMRLTSPSPKPPERNCLSGENTQDTRWSSRTSGKWSSALMPPNWVGKQPVQFAQGKGGERCKNRPCTLTFWSY